MTTTYDVQNILWSLFDASAMKAEITGGIYKRRPAGSNLEDIVVNSLPINSRQLQRTVANVNIYAPNVAIDVNGIQDQTQPDSARLEELTKMAIELLTDVWIDDVHFDVENQSMIRDEETNEHYSNIRVEFYSLNISN